MAQAQVIVCDKCGKVIKNGEQTSVKVGAHGLDVCPKCLPKLQKFFKDFNFQTA